MRGAVRRHAMQHGMRSVATPLAALDRIGETVRPRQKGKRRHHASVFLAHNCHSGSIGSQLLGRRRALGLPRGVAMLRAHKGAGRVIDGHDGGNVVSRVSVIITRSDLTFIGITSD